jgi:LysR family transcriptional regulator, glycine cleavage system transcriptional activator
MVNLNRFHLNGLRAIEVVARQGTLARASEELGTSPSAVSQLIIKAEAQLGRPVFQRASSGLRLTPFGSELVKHLESGFAALAQGVANAIDNQTQVLRVATTLSLAEKWLLRRLPDFQAAHPKIRVQIDTGVTLKDLSQSEVDVALRFGEGQWPGTNSELLTEFVVYPVCSPALARQLKTPQNLYSATIIHYEGAKDRWELYAKIVGLNEPLPDGLSFSEAALCIDAAIAGLGVALSWDILLADALRDGRLVRPFKEQFLSSYSLWFVTAKSRGNDRKIAAFNAWMKRQLKTGKSPSVP